MTDASKVPPFAVEVERQGAVATVAIVGELDIATAPRFEAALRALDPGYETLVIDLSSCSFFASSGISLLLGEGDRARAERFELVVIKAEPDVQRMFDLLGLDDKLTFRERPPA
jgi:anti-sigma B factor antagonist